MAEPLDYQPAETHYTKLTLERTESEVRLVFPPLPQWVQVASLVLNAIFCLAGFAYLIAPFVISIRFRTPLGEILRSVDIFGLIAVPFISLFFAGALVINIIEFRWRSHVPNVLSISNEKLAWTWHWIWKTKTQAFSVHEVESVAIEKVPDIFRRKNIFTLHIRFKSRHPITRILRTNEPNLPNEIADAFRHALNL